MDGRPPLAAFLFAAVIGLLALFDAFLSGDIGRQELLLLAGGAAPVIAFAVLGLAPKRKSGIAA